ncbi:MAG: hypothetical protein J4G17_06325 [Anaerolineae bacterium]|nr:hypothetical protein [Anaerolineae bacterium]
MSKHLIVALSLFVFSLLAIQPVLAQCEDCPHLPVVTGVYWRNYNTVFWDQPADLSIVRGFFVYFRTSFANVWQSSEFVPNTSVNFTIEGLTPTTPWAQAGVYAYPADIDAYRNSLYGPSSTACHGPCPFPDELINWYPPSVAGQGGRLVIDHRLNQHSAAPVAMYRSPAGGALELWGVVSASEGLPLVAVPEIGMLAEAGHPGGELASMAHPANDKPVVVRYLPDSEQIEVSAYYDDMPPYQIDKPYVYRIDRDDRVVFVAW